MKKVLQISEKSKVKKAKAAEIMNLREHGALDVDSKVALIQELIPLGLMHIKEELQTEVKEVSRRQVQAQWAFWARQMGQAERICVCKGPEDTDNCSKGKRHD